MTKWLVHGLMVVIIVLNMKACSEASSTTILAQLQQEIQAILNKTRPAVVTISLKTYRAARPSSDDGFFSLFKEKAAPEKYALQEVCTGVIFSQAGYIVTKSRHINIVDELCVTLYNGQQYQPKLVGADPVSGIAVLKIDVPNLQSVEFSNTDKVEIGSWVTVIGNALGLNSSTAFGIVNEHYDNGLIEISATIQPGNNGSPVFDINGRLIGVVIAQMEPHYAALGGMPLQGRGMVLPVRETREIVDEIIKTARMGHGWLGIQVEPDTGEAVELKISRVVTDSPAAKAGLHAGDFIVMINNVRVRTPDQLGSHMKQTKPGDVVPLVFKRGETVLNTIVTLGKQQDRFLSHMNDQQKGGSLFQAGHNVWRSNIHKEIQRLEQELQYLKSMIQ